MTTTQLVQAGAMMPLHALPLPCSVSCRRLQKSGAQHHHPTWSLPRGGRTHAPRRYGCGADGDDGMCRGMAPCLHRLRGMVVANHWFCGDCSDLDKTAASSTMAVVAAMRMLVFSPLKAHAVVMVVATARDIQQESSPCCHPARPSVRRLKARAEQWVQKGTWMCDCVCGSLG